MIVAIEGLDGCGKTAVCQELKRLHPEWYFTREPSNNTLHGKLARARLQGDNTYPSEALLHLVILSSHEEFAITGAILRDDPARLCITERCAAISGLVYQQDHYDMPSLLPLFRRGVPQPDVAILLRTDPEVARERRDIRAAAAEMFEVDTKQAAYALRYDQLFGLAKHELQYLLDDYRQDRRVVNGNLAFGSVVKKLEQLLVALVPQPQPRVTSGGA